MQLKRFKTGLEKSKNIAFCIGILLACSKSCRQFCQWGELLPTCQILLLLFLMLSNKKHSTPVTTNHVGSISMILCFMCVFGQSIVIVTFNILLEQWKIIFQKSKRPHTHLFMGLSSIRNMVVLYIYQKMNLWSD